jgi:glutamine amidotransferase
MLSVAVAALFFTYLSPTGDFLKTYPISHLITTLRKTVAKLLSLVYVTGGYPRSPSGKLLSHSALNLAISDGSQLVALRFADPPEQDAPSLYWSTAGAATMDRRYKRHPDGKYDAVSGERLRDGWKGRREHLAHVVVASEPMTRDEDDCWHMFENGCMLVLEKGELEKEEGEGWMPTLLSLFQ